MGSTAMSQTKTHVVVPQSAEAATQRNQGTAIQALGIGVIKQMVVEHQKTVMHVSRKSPRIHP